jgi:arsenite methyltransferase
LSCSRPEGALEAGPTGTARTEAGDVPTAEEVRAAVRSRYDEVARAGGCGCGCGCGRDEEAGTLREVSERLGYTAEDLAVAPDGANLGLGCGNPVAIASLAPGETVLDLGSGGGFDCFLAARRVGAGGRVIGVDMTAAMVERARRNARRDGFANVEFRLGEIEHLPVADASVDVILSNCVVNLSTDKAQVLREAYRVLRPGGRLAIVDVVAAADLPPSLRADTGQWAACLAGASSVRELETMLTAVGFEAVRIAPVDDQGPLIRTWTPGTPLAQCVASARIEARKPAPV